MAQRSNIEAAHSAVGLLEHFIGEQSQRATVDTRLGTQEPVERMVSLATVGGTSVVDDHPRLGTRLRIPSNTSYCDLAILPAITHLRKRQPSNININTKAASIKYHITPIGWQPQVTNFL